jgi:modulator of FtsH protease
MNYGFRPELWGDYFLATAGVGAALAGLVFVAFSINLRAILDAPGAVGRGAEALLQLVGPTFVAIVGLWPADTLSRIGLALAAVGIVLWVIATWIQVNWFLTPGTASRIQRLSRVGIGQVATLPTIVAGVSVASGVGLGLDYLLIGVTASLAAGLTGAWVLLVEILR